MAPPAHFSGLIAGTLWMTGASVCFALTYVVVRELTHTMSVFTLVFIRCVFGVLFLTPWLLRNGRGALKTRRWTIYAIRAVTTYTGMVTFFYALRAVDLADANAIQFTGPFFTVILLQVFAGERAGLDRWIAICAGFAGALLIVRPGFGVFVPAMLGIVYTAFAYGASNAATRSLSTTEDNNAVVFYMFAMMLPLSIGPAILDWTTPGVSDLPLLRRLPGHRLLLDPLRDAGLRPRPGGGADTGLLLAAADGLGDGLCALRRGAGCADLDRRRGDLRQRLLDSARRQGGAVRGGGQGAPFDTPPSAATQGEEN